MRTLGCEGLSVLMPAFNEAQNLPEVIEEVLAALPAIAEPHELVVVDDGSTDSTPEILRRLASRHPALSCVRHARNLGYGAALRTGIARARHQILFYTDADGQFDLSELAEFMRPLLDGEADAVIGYRVERSDPWGRRWMGRAWSALVRGLLGVRARDVNCAFKALPAALARSLALEADGACISAELLAKLSRRGARIVERPVTHRPRRAGVATGAHPLVALRAVAELWRLRRAVGHVP